jgi:hypothetical protein
LLVWLPPSNKKEAKMKLNRTTLSLSVALAVGAATAAQADPISHVLLISVDGLHALDVARYVESHPTSALAELSRHGVTYSNARTPSLSDSFPGLLALVTGGSPVSHGLFYDVSYDRTLFAPGNTNCTGAPGINIVFDESIDKYNASGISLDTIDPAKLPRGFKDGKCSAIYPHDAMRANTIFEVVKDHRGHTAWADKHPAYDLVNGPSGIGVDDLYTPEITNAPPTGSGPDATTSVLCTVANDKLKVDAVVNEIQGKKHDGSRGTGTPTVFGMNFQAVSVGQKLSKDGGNAACPGESYPTTMNLTGMAGGYVDGAGTPTMVLQYGLDKTDAALGRMIYALKKEGKYESTLFIVSAKHGQSPINPVQVNKPGHFADLVATLPDAGTSAAAAAIASAAACSSAGCGLVQDDDIALIWLEDQSQTVAVAAYLNINARALFIDQVLAGADLKLKFNDPATDSRTPDIIVQPQYGTIYTRSGKKNAEHGGMSFGDTNVGLIVSNPHLDAQVIKTPVVTSQVAPTILRALDIQADELKSVRIEHTGVLPGLPNR